MPNDSATARAVIGPSAAWSTEAHLLAVIHDAIAAGNWQRQGKASAPKPQPLQRPGAVNKNRTRIGSVSYEPGDIEARLAVMRARVDEGEVTDGS